MSLLGFSLSESSVLWTLAILATIVIVATHFLLLRRRLHTDRNRKAEAASLGIDRPLLQFPFIDAAQCIGCGACRDACPEGDVIGIVGGTATVINGLRCVGHSLCEDACPVGAIEVGLGDIKSRKDIPVLDENQQTSVPGVLVAGELGGLALVRNAVAQGRKAIEHIDRELENRRSRDADAFDVVIVGAGPAGLSAAATAQSRGLSHVVLEREADLGGSVLHYPRKKMVLTMPVDLPPWGSLTKDEYQKETLLELLQMMVRETGVNIAFSNPVQKIERSENSFTLHTEHKTFRAHFVLFALGRRGSPRKLGVPGEDLPKVTYRLIDAASYRDNRVLIVGGGDSAAEAAIGLARQPGNEVVLSYRKEKLVRIKKKNLDVINRLISKGQIQTMFPSNVLEITPRGVRLQLTNDDHRTIENDYVFIFAGGVPPFGLLHQVGVQFGGVDTAAGA